MSKNILLKIITAGEGGVGKTTLLRRYVNGRFESSTLMTIGVEFSLKQVKVGKAMVSLQLWDFGGQERFRFMLSKYTAGAEAALICFDLTRVSSLDHIEEWVNLVRKYDPELPLILIGTKADLTDEVVVDDEYALQAKEEFKMIDFIKTSSKSGENVEEVFKTLAKHVMKRRKF